MGSGLFEGEGSLFVAKQNRPDRLLKVYTYLRMSVTSTDLDVLVKFQDVVGCGLINPRKKAHPHYKDAYNWFCNNTDKTKEIVKAFWPYLGERRRERAIELGLDP